MMAVMAALVAAQPFQKQGAAGALLVHLVQVKTAVTYLVPLTHLVHPVAVAELTAGLPRLVEILLAQRSRVLVAQVTAGLVVVLLELHQLMLATEQTAEEAEEVKTPLVAQAAAMVVCKPFGLIQDRVPNLAPLGVAAALRDLLHQTMAFPAFLVSVGAVAIMP
jgi:hypothetical protein